MEKFSVSSVMITWRDRQEFYNIHIIEKKYQEAALCLIDNLYPYRYTKCRNQFEEAL